MLDQPWVAWEVANAQGTAGGYQPWLLRRGWQPVRKQMDDAYRMGYRVFLIHRPFGEPDQSTGDLMDADARVELLSHPEAGRVIQEYEEFQAQLLRDYPDVQLVAYLGTLLDDDFVNYLKQGNFSAWIDRAHRSYAPLLDPSRVHIGLDFAVEYAPGSPEWKWCEFLQAHLQSQGRECVIESLPRIDRPDQQAFFSLCTEGFWQEQVVTGKVRVAHPRGGVRWWTGQAENSKYFGGDVRRWITDCRQRGFQPCMDWRWIQKYQLWPKDMER